MAEWREMGKILYFLREAINELRCWVIGASDWFNEVCFAAICRLDKIASVAAERKKDRGI